MTAPGPAELNETLADAVCFMSRFEASDVFSWIILLCLRSPFR